MYFDVPEAYVPNLCTLPLSPATRGCTDMPAPPLLQTLPHVKMYCLLPRRLLCHNSG